MTRYGAADEGIVAYLFAKPGQMELRPEVTYVARFAPWELVFAAGAYVDDLEAAFRANLLWLGAIGGVILAITLAFGLVNQSRSDRFADKFEGCHGAARSE